jgi:hypothetical protein
LYPEITIDTPSQRNQSIELQQTSNKNHQSKEYDWINWHGIWIYIRTLIYEYHDKSIGVIIDEVSSSTLVDSFSLSWLKTPKTLEIRKAKNKRKKNRNLIKVKRKQ